MDKDGQEISTHLKHKTVRAIEFSPDGRVFIVGKYNCLVIMENDGQEISKHLQGRSYFALAVSPDGTKIYIGGDKGLVIMDKDGQEISRHLHGQTIFALAVSPDGTHIFIGGYKIGLVIMDKDGQEISTHLQDEYVYSQKNSVEDIAVSPDGTKIYIGGDKGLVIMDKDGQEISRHLKNKTVRAIEFSPDGTRVFIGGNKTGLVIMDKDGQEISTHLKNQTVCAIEFSLDGTRIYIGEDEGLVIMVLSGQEISTHMPDKSVSAIAVSHDESRVFIGGFGNGLVIMDNDGQAISTHMPGKSVYAIKFSPDGTRIYIGGVIGLTIMDKDGQEISTHMQGKSVKIIAVSPDGTRIFIGGYKIGLVIMDNDGQAISTHIPDETIYDIAVSPDGTRIYIGGDKGLNIMDKDGQEISTHLQDKFVEALAVSPDESRVFIGGSEIGLTIIDLNGQEISTHLPGKSVDAIKFSPDGTRIYISGFLMGLKVYDSNFKELLSIESSNKKILTIYPNNILLTGEFFLFLYVEALGFSIDQVEMYKIKNHIPSMSRHSYYDKVGKNASGLAYHIKQDNSDQVDFAFENCFYAFFHYYENVYNPLDAILDTKNNLLFKRLVDKVQSNPSTGNPHIDLLFDSCLSARIEMLLDVPAFQQTIIQYLATSTLYLLKDNYPISMMDFYTDKYYQIVQFKTQKRNSLFLQQLNNKEDIWNHLKNNDDGARASAKVLRMHSVLSPKMIAAILQSDNKHVFYNYGMRALIDTAWDQYFYHVFVRNALLAIVYCMLTVLLLFFSVEGYTLEYLYPCIGLLTALSVYLMYYEVRELKLLGRDYLLDPWNVIDVSSTLSTQVYAVAVLWHPDPSLLAVFAVLAVFFDFCGVLKALRGFRSTGLLISILLANALDMRAFLGVMGVVIAGFGIVFYALMRKPGTGNCWNIDLGDDYLDQTCQFASMPLSLWSTLKLGLLGDFDVGSFQFAHNAYIAFLMFLLAVTVICIIMLNGLIALLGDSFGKVTEHKEANYYRDRLQIMYEILVNLPEEKQLELQDKYKHIHVLVPDVLPEEDYSDNQNNTEQWEGIAKNIKKYVHVELKDMKQDMHVMKKDIAELKDMIAKIYDLNKV